MDKPVDFFSLESGKSIHSWIDEEINGSWEINQLEFYRWKNHPEWNLLDLLQILKVKTMTFLSALDILRRKITPSVNLKFILDFQEEIQFSELAKVVADNKKLFAVRCEFLIMDGTRHFPIFRILLWRQGELYNYL